MNIIKNTFYLWHSIRKPDYMAHAVSKGVAQPAAKSGQSELLAVAVCVLRFGSQDISIKELCLQLGLLCCNFDYCTPCQKCFLCLVSYSTALSNNSVIWYNSLCSLLSWTLWFQQQLRNEKHTQIALTIRHLYIKLHACSTSLIVLVRIYFSDLIILDGNLFECRNTYYVRYSQVLF